MTKSVSAIFQVNDQGQRAQHSTGQRRTEVAQACWGSHVRRSSSHLLSMTTHSISLSITLIELGFTLLLDQLVRLAYSLVWIQTTYLGQYQSPILVYYMKTFTPGNTSRRLADNKLGPGIDIGQLVTYFNYF
ncbi:hypothetical protein RRG08_022606 [Elysia crispata]|uniref:Uncharacterized protein n=1 Tax=Elysia crispata TaxID=231223 RepID=A0AAE1D8H3_9GAST|nr:hypothetical protein RRG08_022606 [Elysia crispata]